MLREAEGNTAARRRQTSLGLAGVALSEGASYTPGKIARWTGEGKPWKDLGARQRAARATVNTSRFFFIGAGALLTAAIVYALSTELFAPNSPTVIYEQACKILENSAKIHAYLLKPYQFQTSVAEYVGDYSPLNPPSRPQRPSQSVSSRRDVNPRTGEETLFLHFFVKARDKDEEISYWQIFRTGVLDSARWLKLKTLDGCDAAVDWWHEQAAGAPTVRDADRTKSSPAEPAKPWWVTRQLRGAVDNVHRAIGSGKDALGVASTDLLEPATTLFSSRPVSGTWTQGEVHIEMAKDKEGIYQYKKFFVDIPSTASPMRHRVRLDPKSGDLPTR
ncbi:hypothetical protein MSPP1_002769 [Malassezia sp. CBS 17886]|nr:hypothetical protein MSPP1_002769 [Malassezia sp. CBS 17886]